MRVTGLRVEHRWNAVGIGTARPRLSWRTVSDDEDWRQAAYEIEVADPVTAGPLWSSGRVEGADSVLVDWDGPPLESRQACEWRVRVWDARGAESEWSDRARFEIGLLDESDWCGQFIRPGWDEDEPTPQPCPHLRNEFDVGEGLVRARLYATALGVYELEINGRRVGDEVLSPGWTSYAHRLRYQTYDVTDLLRPGVNAVGAILGDGWARGHLTWEMARNSYTDHLCLLAQLELYYSDGRLERFVTDESWRSSTGPILCSDLYNGEVHDARRELKGWSQPGYTDDAWDGVRVDERDLGVLVAPPGPPVRRTEDLSPREIATAPSGEIVVDFGQNLVGRVRLRVAGPAGSEIVMRHAEVLDADGELEVTALRQAEATDRYILSGADGGEEWEPRFTFHGFRYLGVTGWPGQVGHDSFTAVVCHSDMTRTGWFECSDERVNQLHENIRWGMRGNFLDVPTDCPQRDERLGWTGDIEVFVTTATLLYDTAGFLTNWLADLDVDQAEDGCVPWVVPVVPLDYVRMGAAGWGDAAVVVPSVVAHRSGDLDLLRSQYPSMRAWVDWVRTAADDDLLWTSGFQFGDWLDPSAPPDQPMKAQTDPTLVATAWFAHSARLLAIAAKRLGFEGDAVEYDALAGQVAEAFRSEFVTPNGRVVGESQTAYLLALAFELLLPAQRECAQEQLTALIADNGHMLATGFLGTPLLCEVLTRIGCDDLAYRLLLQRKCPSWLYQVDNGATTVWERWDAILPGGGVNPAAQMTSFNHYAFGAVGSWLYERVAGIRQDPDSPGWKRFLIEPHPGGGLTSAAARVDSPYGTIGSSWRIDGDAFTLAVAVPPNTRATIRLPGSGEKLGVGSGRHRWETSI